MNEDAILLEALCVRKGGAALLDDVTARVGRGELVGVLGPNGAGKTTLLRVMTGFEREVAGRAEVLGEPVPRLRGARLARLRSRIGYAPQLHGETPSVPIRLREVVAMGRSGRRGLLRRLTAEDSRVVDECLERLGLSTLADRPYAQLSGGERRKAHLARALAQEPELLLLDEPTSNLDPRWQNDLSQLIESLWQELRLTVVFVTHTAEFLPPSTSRVLLLADGRLHGDGGPDEVLRPATLAAAFGAPVDVVRRGGRRYLLMGAGTEAGGAADA